MINHVRLKYHEKIKYNKSGIALIDRGIVGFKTFRNKDEINVYSEYRPWNNDWSSETTPAEATGDYHGTLMASIMTTKINNIGIAGVSAASYLHSVKLLRHTTASDYLGILSNSLNNIGIYTYTRVMLIIPNYNSIANNRISYHKQQNFHEALKMAKSNRMVAVAPVGHHPEGHMTTDTKKDYAKLKYPKISYPLGYDFTKDLIIPVTALSSSGKILGPFYSDRTTFAAPAGLYAKSGLNDDENIIALYPENDHYSLRNFPGGSCIAAAHVTAIIAEMFFINSFIEVDQVRDILKRTATQITIPGSDTYYVYKVNMKKALFETFKALNKKDKLAFMRKANVPNSVIRRYKDAL